MAGVSKTESYAMPHTAAPTLPSVIKNAAGKLLLISFLGLALYLIVCLVCQLALRILVPLDATDYQFSSWLIIPPLLGASAQYFGLMACVYALWALLVSRKVYLFLLGLIVAALMASMGSQLTSLRSALLHGEAKVGCYNYSGKACLEMLGLPAAAAPYDLDEIPSPQLHSMPIMIEALVRAPFDLVRSDEMGAMVQAQREELAAHRHMRQTVDQR